MAKPVISDCAQEMSRRRVLQAGLALAAVGAVGGTGAVFAQVAEQGGGKRREVFVGGKRVKVIDMHSHCSMRETVDVVKNTPLSKNMEGRENEFLSPKRLQMMDERGIDVSVQTINDFWWYSADRDLATRIVQVNDENLSAWCSAHPDRFIGFSSPALQFPDLAAQQLEHAVKQLGMRGAAVGGHVEGQPLSDPKFDPFWAKAQELGVVVFMHPNHADNVVKPGGLRGKGALDNTIGNPLETTIFLSNLIFEGTLDRFPKLRICASHGGGFLPSYLGRSDMTCGRTKGCTKKPSDYFKDQILVDAMVFSEEGIRHLVAEMGSSQVVYGTDMPANWPDYLDAILRAPITDAQKEAILYGNAAKILRI